MTRAAFGWLAVAATVAVYDAWAVTVGDETLSGGYRRAYAAHPVLVGAATAYLLGHLTGHLPARYDLLRRAT